MEIGNPNKGERKKKNYFYIGQGSNVYRILPPMGALAKDGVWSKYYEVHFGYKNAEGRMKPFQSCEVKSRDRKMIEVPDAAKERIKKLEGQLAAIKERMKVAPSAELKVAQENIEKVIGYDGVYSLEKRHYMNAVNDKGEIGLLALKHREKLALEEARKEIETKYGLDVLGISGAYLEFRKSGKGLDTIVKVSGHMILQTDGSERLNKHTVDESIIRRLGTEAFELDKLYYQLSPEETEAIVLASEQGPKEEGTVVSSIFAKYEPARAASAPKAEARAEQRSEAIKEDQEAKAQKEAEAKAMAALANVSVTQTEEAPVKAKVEKKAEVKSAPVAAQSDDDFLASIGAKG